MRGVGMDQTRDQLEEAERQLAATVKEKKDLATKLAELERAKALLNAEVVDLRGSKAELTDRMNSLSDLLSEKDDQLSKAAAEKDDLEREVAKARGMNSKLERKVKSLQNSRAKNSKEVNDLLDRICEKDGILASAKNDKEELVRMLELEQGMKIQFQSEARGLRDRLSRKHVVMLGAFVATVFFYIPAFSHELSKELQFSKPCTQRIDGREAGGIGWEEIEEKEGDILPIMKSKSRGFRPVHIFSRVDTENRQQFSQDGQDELILKLTKANDNKVRSRKTLDTRAPYFVDLAANDPLILSNTYLLEHKWGWRGLCIEPNHRYWYRLASLRTCTIIGAFVGGPQSEDGKEIPVVLSNARKGGIVGRGMDNTNKVEEKRNIVSIATVFNETKVPSVIDYFSLDVEGAESLVMEDFPWDQYTFKFITIERPKDDLKVMLVSHGYRLAKTISDYDETLWINEEMVLLSQEEIDKIAGNITIIPNWKIVPQ